MEQNLISFLLQVSTVYF